MHTAELQDTEEQDIKSLQSPPPSPFGGSGGTPGILQIPGYIAFTEVRPGGQPRLLPLHLSSRAKLCRPHCSSLLYPMPITDKGTTFSILTILLGR